MAHRPKHDDPEPLPPDNDWPEALEELIAQATDDFICAVRNGEAPDVGEFAARYPQVRDELVQILPALAAIGDTSRSEGSASNSDSNVGVDDLSAGREQLGDFLIRKPIGRGGMGVVYEAEQRSLGRTVALKVLPFAAMLDEHHRNRFRNEARAAATLSHPNIVPIYSVGVERGVHYFAMQLVDGETLAEIVHRIKLSKQNKSERPAKSRDDSQPATDDFHVDGDSTAISAGKIERTSTSADTKPIAELSTQWSQQSNSYFRSLAKLGLQAARAIDHAHDQGVLHRDIKPGNLMVDRDGKLWVTDFGLARLDTGASITASGDIVGTLRYMSPEQALGQRGIVDQRSDVYSLGATLYELLTLEPALDGDDRATLLNQIATHQPVAIKRIAPRTPVELQTIVQKAMEKNPEHRYSSAKEMGDDLQRFLEDRPIKARPPRPHEHVAKWARRHPGFVASAALILLLVAVGLSVSTWIIAQERQRADKAFLAERDQRQRADANLKLARETIHEAYSQEAKKLEDEPQMTERQREFFGKVVAFYEDLPKIETGDRQIRLETAIAYERLANLHSTLGDHRKAADNYDKAITVLQGLLDESIKDHDVFGDLIYCLIAAGDVAQKTSDLAASRRFYNDAQKRIGEAAKHAHALRSPHFANEQLGVIEHRIALIDQRVGDVESARKRFQESIRIKSLLSLEKPDDLDYLYEIAKTELDFARFLFTTFGDNEASDWYSAAEERARQLCDAERKRIRGRHLLAQVKNDQSLHYRSLGELRDARRAIEESLHVYRPLADDFPDRRTLQLNLQSCYSNLATILSEMGELHESELILRQLVENLSNLEKDSPDDLDRLELQGGAYSNLAKVLELQGKHDERKELTYKAFMVWKRLAETKSDEPELKEKLAIGYYSYASTLNPVEALPILDTAASHLRPLVEQYPAVPSYRDRLTNLYVAKAEAHEALGQYELALKAHELQFRHTRELVDRWPRTPEFQQKLAKQFLLVGRLQLKLEDYTQATASFQRGLSQRAQVAQLFPDLVDARNDRACARLETALAVALTGQAVEAQDSDRNEIETLRRQAIENAAIRCIPGNCVGWLTKTPEFQELPLEAREEFFEAVDREMSTMANESGAVWSAKRLATLVNRANWLIDEEQWDGAETVLERATPLAIEFKDKLPRFANSLVWTQIGRWPAPDRWVESQRPESECPAFQIAKGAADADPADPANWNTLGYVYLLRDEYDRGKAALLRAVSLRDGGNAYDWALLALCCKRQNQIEESNNWLDRLRTEAAEQLETDSDLQRIVTRIDD